MRSQRELWAAVVGVVGLLAVACGDGGSTVATGRDSPSASDSVLPGPSADFAMLEATPAGMYQLTSALDQTQLLRQLPPDSEKWTQGVPLHLGGRAPVAYGFPSASSLIIVAEVCDTPTEEENGVFCGSGEMVAATVDYGSDKIDPAVPLQAAPPEGRLWGIHEAYPIDSSEIEVQVNLVQTPEEPEVPLVYRFNIGTRTWRQVDAPSPVRGLACQSGELVPASEVERLGKSADGRIATSCSDSVIFFADAVGKRGVLVDRTTGKSRDVDVSLVNSTTSAVVGSNVLTLTYGLGDVAREVADLPAGVTVDAENSLQITGMNDERQANVSADDLAHLSGPIFAFGNAALIRAGSDGLILLEGVGEGPR